MPWNDGLDNQSPAYGIAADQNRFIRVVAGPGTGKSFALKRRVARLLENGVAPRGILPVTFTNVAAEDLKREMMQVGVPGCTEIRGSTLHALGMRILSRAGVLQATGRHPRPLNEFEQEPLLYDLTNAFGNKRAREKKIQAYEAAWARLQHEQPGYAPQQEDRDFERSLIAWLRFHQGMLIGEIVPILHSYLQNNPAAPERNLYTHILVDEYQDLNKAEQGLIDLLTGDAELCIVGDDDQSLYSFKHAHPDGIRDFPATHQVTADHEILQCRRCPTRVVDMANSLIGNNLHRVNRQLAAIPANGRGEVQLLQFQTLVHEARGIATLVADLINTQGWRPQDILVLAQRRAIGDAIFQQLRARTIPSKSYYQEGDIAHIEAQDRFAVFKLLLDRDDRIALRWLLGYGSNDFRSGAYARLREACEASGETPWHVLEQLEQGTLTIRHTRHLIERFREIQAALAQLQDIENLADFVAAWLPPTLTQLTDFRALVASVIANVDTRDELLTELVKAISTPDIPPDVTEVRIMSLHKSKGLSSPVVIIAGCVEGVLPPRSDAASLAQQEAEMEEQRRLFYVGITRVKAEAATNRQGHLILTCSRTMTLADAMGAGIQPAGMSFGNVTLLTSRFLRELGPSSPTIRAA